VGSEAVMYEIHSPVTSVTRRTPNEQPSCSELRDRHQTGPIASEPPQECERGQKKRNGEEEQEKRGRQNKEKKAESKEPSAAAWARKT
jgi:hypothetical protein